ncbi:MAG: hypothetical protein HGA22_12640 [Clostridiales bacterium]|nr:hypothetical protein [Clostridiales bacterium]
MKVKTQAYNDGVCSIYSVGNTADPGNMPKQGITIKEGPLRFEERTVGMSRFWNAKQAAVKIDRLIRMPKLISVSSQDIAVFPDGSQYEIKQVQYPPEVVPPSMDLSLERVVKNYATA